MARKSFVTCGHCRVTISEGKTHSVMLNGKSTFLCNDEVACKKRREDARARAQSEAEMAELMGWAENFSNSGRAQHGGGR